MSEKKISYNSRTFEDYKKSLREYITRYYPEISNDFNDASIGSWMIDLVAAVSDNLSFHIDRVFNETSVDSAQQKSSLYALARSNGFKVPGPKGAMTEVKFKCVLPIDNTDNSNPDYTYAPIIKKGTKLSSSNQVFEVMDDIDFSEQYNKYGISDREVIPQLNSNSDVPVSYVITKTATVVAGESRIYKQVVNTNTIKPFMEVILPDSDVMNVESVIFKSGGDYTTTPTNNEFLINKEYVNCSTIEIYRFFEVDSLMDQYRWTYKDEDTTEEGKQYTNHRIVDEDGVSITIGEWKPLLQKFITEFTDNGYLKIIFGSGLGNGQEIDYSSATNFAQAQISRMICNNNMGILPPHGEGGDYTMYVKYRVGGGASSNIAAGSLNSISYLDCEIGRNATNSFNANIANNVKKSISVTNTIPSVSGKDAPSVEELKNMIKYHNAAQQRCVTVKDYENRILQMPPQYGSPFRVKVTEENNKIMVYLIGIDHEGKLTTILPEQLIKNIINYLSMYRTINDFVEIKSGKIINLSFEVDLFVDKNYNYGDVIKNVIATIKNYMNINNLQLGEDIFVGDIQKEISKVDGVINLIDIRVYNEFGSDYSGVESSQKGVDLVGEASGDVQNGNRKELDLVDSEYVLITDSDSIFEIKYPERDIRIKIKTR